MSESDFAPEGAALSKDGSLVALFGNEGAGYADHDRDPGCSLWDLRTGRRRANKTLTEPRIITVAVAPEGRQFAALTSRGNAYVWDAGDGRLVARLGKGDLPWSPLARRMGGVVHASGTVAFSPDGRHAAVAYGHPDVAIFDLTTGEAIQVLKDPDPGHLRPKPTQDTTVESDRAGGHAIAAVYSPRGLLMAVWHFDGILRVWDLTSGKVLTTVRHPLPSDSWGALETDPVVQLLFSPDERRLMTVVSEDSVRVWEIATGQELNRFVDEDFGVKSAAYTREGVRIVVAEASSPPRVSGTRRPAHPPADLRGVHPSPPRAGCPSSTRTRASCPRVVDVRSGTTLAPLPDLPRGVG